MIYHSRIDVILYVRGFVIIPALSPLIRHYCSNLNEQCLDYAYARASSVLSSKDNRTVILTRQDFFPDRPADGDFLFTFSSNILDFRRNLSSYWKFGSRHEDSSRHDFIALGFVKVWRLFVWFCRPLGGSFKSLLTRRYKTSCFAKLNCTRSP